MSFSKSSETQKYLYFLKTSEFRSKTSDILLYFGIPKINFGIPKYNRISEVLSEVSTHFGKDFGKSRFSEVYFGEPGCFGKTQTLWLILANHPNFMAIFANFPNLYHYMRYIKCIQLINLTPNSCSTLKHTCILTLEACDSY